VRVLDVLDAQVHGEAATLAHSEDVEMIRGDILDEAVLHRALEGIEVVFHQAASVGVGQSMYEPASYTRVNSLGTAGLMGAITSNGAKVEKVVVASSMSLYGEGKYACQKCGPLSPPTRREERLSKAYWEPDCPHCGAELTPLPTDEETPPLPTSVYAITKRCQEETVLVMGRAYGIPSVALRYFNVYGPGQSLSNPYTGVAAIFASRILNGARPILFEDGGQSRDFTHVSDIVQANLLAMEKSEGDYRVFNVGTGIATPLMSLTRGLLHKLRPQGDVEPQIPGSFRQGDIRHCYADISRIRRDLGYEPRVSLEEGFDDLADWARTQRPVDRTEQAFGELRSRGLVH